MSLGVIASTGSGDNQKENHPHPEKVIERFRTIKMPFIGSRRSKDSIVLFCAVRIMAR
jgi:hypothetical protein